MEKSRKNLKTYSFLVLLFGAVSLIKAIVELCFVKIDMSQLPEGTTEETVLIAKIVILVLSVIVLLPQFYVGFKGLRIAKNPTASRTHIKWAIVLLVITALALVSPIVEIVKGNHIGLSVSTLCDLVLEGTIYFEYIRYARSVAKEIS